MSGIAKFSHKPMEQTRHHGARTAGSSIDETSNPAQLFLTRCRKHILDTVSNTLWPGIECRRPVEGNLRPREFDHDDVLRIAFDQFWRKGVRGTSLSDIARDAGVQRGSLYNAFGSKEALFLSAYERYASEYLSSVQKALGSGTSRARLTAFFDLTIRNFRSGSPPRGCPTTRGLMEVSPVEGEGLDENARQAFADLMARITALVQEALSEGIERGEFEGDPKGAALHIVTVTRGLAVLERAFGDESQLRKIATYTVDLVLGRKSR
jgi:TetR/AcrR family transcriptional regulator, transcriptional repressor for nem operon